MVFQKAFALKWVTELFKRNKKRCNGPELGNQLMLKYSILFVKAPQ